MIKKGTRLSLFLTAVLGFLSISVGHAAFQTGENGATDSYDGQVTLRKPVCYISGSPNVYYPSIEKALKVAESTSGSQTVYVIPGANPTIQSDCTIAAGDSLILPYSGETYEDSSRSTNGSYFADATASLVTSNRKSLVTVADNVTITNYGRLVVGGVLGTQPQPLTGATIGNYSEIQLGDGAKIVNDGTHHTKSSDMNGMLQLFGYIKSSKENPTVDPRVSLSTGARIKMPFVIYDFRGGSYTYACQQENYMPFNVYDFPNCHAEILCDSSSYLIGLVSFQTSAGETLSEANVICPSSATGLFKIASGTVSIRYRPATFGYSTNDCTTAITSLSQANRTTIRINGQVEFSSIKMSIKALIASVTIDTSTMVPGFCHKFNIFLDSGSVTMNNQMKFTTGFQFTVAPGATLTVNNKVCMYQNFVCEILYSGAYRTSFLGSASLINNGTVNLNSAFGGKILTNTETGTINTGSGFTNYATVTEAIQVEGSSVTAKVSKTESRTETAVAIMASKRFDSNSDTAYQYSYLGEKTLSAGKVYSSKDLIDSDEYGWFASDSSDYVYGIRYVLNSPTASMPSGYVDSFYSNGGNVALLAPTNTDVNYSLEGLYYDEACTSANKLPLEADGDPYIVPNTAKSFVGGKNFITLYAKWNDLTAGSYSVSVVSKKQAANKQSITESSAVVTEVPTSDTFTLQNKTGNQIYYYSGINASAGTGTFNVSTFNGYTIQVRDAANSLVDTISVNASGNSSDGSKVSGFVISPSACGIEKDYTLSVSENYSNSPTAYTISVSGDTSELKQGKKRTFSASGVDSMINFGISLSYQWSSSDSSVPGYTPANEREFGIVNNYTKSTILLWGKEVAAVTVTLNSVADGSIVLASSRTIGLNAVSVKVG